MPVLGIVLVLMSEDVFEFSQAWISLSFVLYIVAIGLLHGLHLPTVRRINAADAELAGRRRAGQRVAGPVAELDKLGQEGGRWSAACSTSSPSSSSSSWCSSPASRDAAGRG